MMEVILPNGQNLKAVKHRPVRKRQSQHQIQQIRIAKGSTRRNLLWQKPSRVPSSKHIAFSILDLCTILPDGDEVLQQQQPPSPPLASAGSEGRPSYQELTKLRVESDEFRVKSRDVWNSAARATNEEAMVYGYIIRYIVITLHLVSEYADLCCQQNPRPQAS